MLRKIAHRIRTSSLVAFVVFCVAAPPQAFAAEGEIILAAGGDADFAELSLEELMDIQVYSVSKRAQSLNDSAAAIYVLTQDDIRRTGATSIPELLRWVPGMEVAHIDANTWAITARGFNDRFANKLLVLIDGRSVYTPLFAGVYWDVQDTLIEDIDRIEVIRGPGGTLWGANAVNGVINIITKSAVDTQGVLVAAGGGTEENFFSQGRYGGKIGDNAHYRVYGKYFDRGVFEDPADGDADDDWGTGQGGFRIDAKLSDKNELMIKGDGYQGERDNGQLEAQLAAPYVTAFDSENDVVGGNIIARWTHTLSEDVQFNLQAYYDRTERDDEQFSEHRDTIDIEFQNDIRLFERNRFSWGLGYRWNHDDIQNEFVTSFEPDSDDVSLFSGFAQNELSLFDDTLFLTVGTKVEHNDYTGWEFQPSGRALWKVAEHHTVWGAISRAVRTPSRAENDIILNTVVIPPGVTPPGFPGPPNPAVPTVIQLLGNSGYDSENLLAYELGYRAQLHETFSLDLATYYNDYDDLRTVALDPTAPVEPLLDRTNIRFLAGNDMEGEAYGAELAVDWLPRPDWRVRAGYAYIDINLDLDGPAVTTDSISEGAERASPHNTVFIRNLIDLPYELELDTNLRYVDNVPSADTGAYVNLDVRLGWKPTENWEWAVVGQNLLEDNHKEFGASAFVSSEVTRVPRGVYFKITYTR
jgi:iron complex outermembrane receptor protein